MMIYKIFIFFLIMYVFYKRTYKRNKKTKYRIILVNRTSKYLRAFSLAIAFFLLVSKKYMIYITETMSNGVASSVDIFLLFAFTALLVYRCYLEIQNDVITDDELFIREGNYNLKYLKSYTLKVSHEFKFSDKDVKFDELLLIMSPSNIFEKTFKGKYNFDIKIRVKKEDVGLVIDILDKHIIN